MTASARVIVRLFRPTFVSYVTAANTTEDWPTVCAMFIHWFDVTDRIVFKLCVQVYKC